MQPKENIVGVIVGIDKTNNTNLYRTIACKYNTNESGNATDWEFKCTILPEVDMINYMKTTPINWLNAKLENNSIKGRSASFNRFTDSNSNHHPYVIISQINTPDGRTLGYKVANYNGQIQNVKLKDILDYSLKATKNNNVPIQNAIYVDNEVDKAGKLIKKAFIKSYPECPFIIEQIAMKKQKSDVKTTVNIQENKKTLNHLEEIYSKDQLKVLYKGKKQGLKISIYANPKLSAEQMEVLRNGLEKKINVTYVANPAFDTKCMRYYIDCLKYKIDIRRFLDPKYSLGQLSELSAGVEAGIDISPFKDPSLSPTDMAEIRERLESKIWREAQVIKDESWK